MFCYQSTILRAIPSSTVVELHQAARPLLSLQAPSQCRSPACQTGHLEHQTQASFTGTDQEGFLENGS